MLQVETVFRPQSIDEAVAMVGQEPEARFLFAGTDIVPQLRDKVPGLTKLIDLTGIKDLPNDIRFDGKELLIGGMATHRKIAQNADVQKYFPALAAACGGVGSAQIRARACIAGNLANASPACDSAPALLAADAVIQYQNADGKHEIPISEFFLSPRRIAIGRQAVITGIRIAIPEGGYKGGYYKVGGRTALTIAMASAAVLYSKETGYRVAYGSVGPKTLRGVCTEGVLNSGDYSADDLKNAVLNDISPIDDIRASGEYRKMICVNMLRKAVLFEGLGN